MWDLFLLILENFDNNIHLLAGAILLIAGYSIFMKKRGDFLFRTAYVDRKIYEEFGKQLRHMILMYVPTVVLVQILYSVSAYLHKDKAFYPRLYVSFYLPMLCLIIWSQSSKVVRQLQISREFAALMLIPGTLFHVFFLAFILCAKRGIWIIILLMIFGVIVPTLSSHILIYIVSDKDIKMVELKLTSGKVYHNRYSDVIDDGKDEFISVKVRKKNGSVKEIKKIRREDIAEKKIYLKKPKEKMKK